MKALTSARRTKLLRLFDELTSLGEDPFAVFERAVRVVAADEFWQKKRYGLENLLRDGRVVAKAESMPDVVNDSSLQEGARVRFTDYSTARRPELVGVVTGRDGESLLVSVGDREFKVAATRVVRVAAS